MTTKIIASALRSNGYYLDVANNTLYTTAPFEKKSNIYGTQEYKLVCEIMSQYPNVQISIQKKRKSVFSHCVKTKSQISDTIQESSDHRNGKLDMTNLYYKL